MAKAVKLLPETPVGRPTSEWSASELLDEVTRLGLQRAIELMTPPVTNVLDPREQRRIEIGINAGARILARVHVAKMQAEAGEERMVEYEAAVKRYEQRYGVSERT